MVEPNIERLIRLHFKNECTITADEHGEYVIYAEDYLFSGTQFVNDCLTLHGMHVIAELTPPQPMSLRLVPLARARNFAQKKTEITKTKQLGDFELLQERLPGNYRMSKYVNNKKWYIQLMNGTLSLTSLMQVCASVNGKIKKIAARGVTVVLNSKGKVTPYSRTGKSLQKTHRN